jgi:protein arginine kinase activator
MLCDFCREREAIIYMEQTAPDGQRRKLNICLECALQRGISPDPKNIESSIGSLFKEMSELSKKISRRENKICPVCGNSLNEIKRTKTTGCPECYSIFKNEIRALMEKNGIKEIFKGKMPVRLSSVRSVLNDRVILQNKLNVAVEKEDYEKAAIYRDCLKALEKNAVNGIEDSGEKGISV